MKGRVVDFPVGAVDRDLVTARAEVMAQVNDLPLPVLRWLEAVIPLLEGASTDQLAQTLAILEALINVACRQEA